MQLPLFEPIQILLNADRVVLIDPEDADLRQLHWTPYRNRNVYYATRKTKNKTVWMHRVILERLLGRELVKGEYVDHKNGDGLDNRRANLRLATNSQNQLNQRRNSANTSGYKGVGWHRARKGFRARIKFQGKRLELGIFKTAEEAHEAYKQAALRYAGEFARFE